MSKKTLFYLLLVPLGVWALTVSGGRATPLDPPRPLPAFHTQDARDWLNSPPLRTEDLRGRVLLIDFWTFDCWNCYRSFPWLKALEARLDGEAFQVIGVHTPEFEHEKLRTNVIAKIDEFGLSHPVVMDNDFRYWRAFDNRYWPAFYLVDKQGQIRHRFVGETHAGDARAEAVEREIRALLAE